MRKLPCTIHRNEVVYNEYKQPTRKLTKIGESQVTITIYSEHNSQDIRFNDVTHTIILPKEVLLDEGDVVEINGVKYTILIVMEYGTLYQSYYGKKI